MKDFIVCQTFFARTSLTAYSLDYGKLRSHFLSLFFYLLRKRVEGRDFEEWQKDCESRSDICSKNGTPVSWSSSLVLRMEIKWGKNVLRLFLNTVIF